MPAKNLTWIRDPYAKFEASLPFSRILLPLMLKKVEDAEKKCGEKGYVTLAALADELKTEAWKDL